MAANRHSRKECLCSWRPDRFEVWPDDVEAFVANFRLLRETDWFGLFCCIVCDQLWCFDHISRSNIAAKITSESEWENIDFEAIRMEVWMDAELEHSGGYSDEFCRKKGCFRRALNGRAFCLYHWFNE